MEKLPVQPGVVCHVLRHSRTVLLILVLAAVSTPAAQPDSSTTRQQEVDLKRLGYVGVGAAGLHWYGFRQLEKNWWQGEKVPLRLVHDWSGDSYLNLDHASHFMWGLFLAQATGDLYRWIGFSPRTAALLGSLSSIAEMFYVEYRDGRYGHWGFSTPDATADVLGALVPLVHASVPATRVVRFKLSYFPSPLFRYGHVRQAGGHPYVLSFMDDYEGMTFWMVMDPRPLLPGHAAGRWPDWLGVAVGVGAQGLHGYGRTSRGPDRWDPDLPDAQREIYLSLDFDFAHSLGNFEVLRRFTPYFRLVRFPTPALRIHPTPTLYLLYF
ncbi:MAG: DUF2279 domain-containing protein [Gemmatimonadaceae bacterium]|nr:DUF2279 domain-containing protein [Gemmatimonadaceae bacterium]